MSQLSAFYSPLTAADLGLGNSANVTFGSVTTGAVTASGPLSGTGFTDLLAAPPAIGNTTPAAGSFTTLTANNGTLTASAPVLDLSQTWNASGVAFTALRVNVTNTSSAAQSPLLDLQVNGSSRFSVWRNDQVRLFGKYLAWFTTEGFETSAAVNGAAPARFCCQSTGGEAGIRASGNVVEVMGATATNPQTFNIYNTFTSATNHERGFLRWSSNVFQIGTEKGSGGGTARALEFQTDGTTQLTLDTSGHLFPPSSNSRDIGSSSLRFRWGYFFTGIALGNTSTGIGSSGDGLIQLRNNNNSSFGRLQFGGTTSSFPALKRDSTALHVRLADDSAFAPLSCGALTLNGNLDASTRDLVTDTTTGTKIGTGTTQKIGFFNATPVVQQAAVADATDAASTQARLNDLLARLRTLGLIAT